MYANCGMEGKLHAHTDLYTHMYGPRAHSHHTNYVLYIHHISMHTQTHTISTCRSIPLQDNIDWEDRIKQISKSTTGFSGREISKLVIAWQVSSYRCECVFGINVCP